MPNTTKKNRKQTEVKKVLDSVIDLQPQSVIEEIGVLQSNLQTTLAGLSAQISNKLDQMRHVEEAIQIKETELQELYAIEKEAMTIEEVVALREAKETEWEKENTQRKITWEEDEEERNKRWQREEEEHAYEVTQKAKRFQEEHNNEVTSRHRLEAIRQSDLQKGWKEREEKIAAQEKEFQDLKTQVDGFENRLKAEIAKAEAIAVSRVKKDYEHEVLMAKKDVDAERALNSTKITALDDTINGFQNQILDLQKQLAEARMDAKEVTSAALRSASGRQAMQALQRVVDQGSTSGKSK